jgi:hypothetical protein
MYKEICSYVYFETCIYLGFSIYFEFVPAIDLWCALRIRQSYSGLIDYLTKSTNVHLALHA